MIQLPIYLTSGSPINAMPKDNFLFIPPDKSEANLDAFSSKFNVFSNKSVACLRAALADIPFS